MTPPAPQQSKRENEIAISSPLSRSTVNVGFTANGTYVYVGNSTASIKWQLSTATSPSSTAWVAGTIDTENTTWLVNNTSNVSTGGQNFFVGLFDGSTAKQPLVYVTEPITVAVPTNN
jgi:hypothetical protein